MAPDPAAIPSHRDLARRLDGLNIYLVGMMGAGKSAVGRPLAEALGYCFIDADATLTEAAGRPIAEIFASDGEEAFRALETSVLNGIASWHSLVVATGGGAVTRPENWGHMRQGVVVWLDAPEAELLRRLAADPTRRPLLDAPDPAGRLQALLQERRPLYAQADLAVVQEGGQPSEVALQVLAALPAILRDPALAPVHPARLQDADGQARSSFN
jgi:shikimate kinase